MVRTIANLLVNDLGVPASAITRLTGHGNADQPDPNPRSPANRVVVITYPHQVIRPRKRWAISRRDARDEHDARDEIGASLRVVCGGSNGRRTGGGAAGRRVITAATTTGGGRGMYEAAHPGSLLACSANPLATFPSPSGARLFIGHARGISCWEVHAAAQNTPGARQRAGCDATTDVSIPARSGSNGGPDDERPSRLRYGRF